MRPGKTPTLTVIIPTYRRHGELMRTVGDLRNQDAESFDVLIIDQTPDVPESVREWFHSLPENYRYLRKEKPSLPGARNLGAQHAKGEIWLFVDDDVRLPVHFISAHLGNYVDPTVMAVAGPILSPEMRWKSKLPKGACHPLYGQWVGCWQYDRRWDVRHAPGGNHSYRSVVYESAGRYDENFTGPALREESDFFLRVVKAGFRIVYDPRSWLVHVVGDTNGGCRGGGMWYQYDQRCLNHAYFVLKNFRGDELRLFFDHARSSLLTREALCRPWSLPRRLSGLLSSWKHARAIIRIALR